MPCAIVPGPGGLKITPVPDSHLIILGSLSTTNIIMASWSRAMRQKCSEPSDSHVAIWSIRATFFSAAATVCGN
ncbi:hypothetical protein KIN20_012482 [Parelaphostrongylus tenuis]|uniref:Uncharacterized protein n=1 Tax=Parelaphostrongylus tenuis TaxID=148309 RepID=A0AAD5MFA3_PARTN|nr:hypothetical protein KIN20_012482 [Parelaphostrongylus tenuis]